MAAAAPAGGGGEPEPSAVTSAASGFAFASAASPEDGESAAAPFRSVVPAVLSPPSPPRDDVRSAREVAYVLVASREIILYGGMGWEEGGRRSARGGARRMQRMSDERRRRRRRHFFRFEGGGSARCVGTPRSGGCNSSVCFFFFDRMEQIDGTACNSMMLHERGGEMGTTHRTPKKRRSHQTTPLLRGGGEARVRKKTRQSYAW